MKGEKVVTNLVPYGPEKPRAGMVKMASTDQVITIFVDVICKISWRGLGSSINDVTPFSIICDL